LGQQTFFFQEGAKLGPKMRLLDSFISANGDVFSPVPSRFEVFSETSYEAM
jgi:hypothetical protein